MALFISLAAGAINVIAMNRGSSIGVGEVSAPGWSQNGKSNFGDGQLFGCNVQAGFLTTVIDNDFIDSPINEVQPSSSLQSQTG